MRKTIEAATHTRGHTENPWRGASYEAEGCKLSPKVKAGKISSFLTSPFIKAFLMCQLFQFQSKLILIIFSLLIFCF